jgi:hypothetical protein
MVCTVFTDTRDSFEDDDDDADDVLITAIDVVRTTVPIRNDRQRLLDAAASLITAIEAVRPAREMEPLRGDLNALRRDAERVRRVIDQQPPPDRWIAPYV